MKTVFMTIMAEPSYINKEKVASLLPMEECIGVIEHMFRSISSGECHQPLRSLMWLPDRSGLLGMMPAHAQKLGIMGIKVITVFHGNREAGLPSHQGVVILFESNHGSPLLVLDASEITAIRTAAASAVATRHLSRENSEILSIIGSGVQAEKHIEAIRLVRKIKMVNLWSRDESHAERLAEKISIKWHLPAAVCKTIKDAVDGSDILCTVTSSAQPLLKGEWLNPGIHINAVGSSIASSRELDTAAILRGKLFTDCYESIFNEAGDFLIPKKEGAIDDSFVKGELGEVITGKKKGRENAEEITLFKSLGIANEDLFSAWHIYNKIKPIKS